MPNAEALKLPDQLLVRYYRQGKVDDVKIVAENPKTRDIRVTRTNGAIDHWKYMLDLGWIPGSD